MILKILFVALVALSSGSAFACDPNAETFYVSMYLPGPNWKGGVDIFEQDLRAHAEYLTGLYDQKVLKAGGPFMDSSGGMAVFCVANMAEAEKLVQADPGVISGVLKATIKEWYQVFKYRN
jgi:uncharacterized protein YciI